MGQPHQDSLAGALAALPDPRPLSPLLLMPPGLSALVDPTPPAGLRFFAGTTNHMAFAPLDFFKHCVLGVGRLNVAGHTSHQLGVRYCLTPSGNVNNWLPLGVGGEDVVVPCNTTNTLVNSGWIEIADEARAPVVYLALIEAGGNGVLSPTFGRIELWLRM